MAIALYARKSIERENSISCETQIEYCKAALKPEERAEKLISYIDNGYSGGNVDRAGYQRMMADIRAGRITKVMVYRLDRISRSLIHFVEMLEEFKQYHVEFSSSQEAFDTSSPYGELVVKMLALFAEFERQSIINRITQAYQHRSEMGFYMGGRRPYGFELTPVVIHNIHTKQLSAKQGEDQQIRYIFETYAQSSVSLGRLKKELQAKGMDPLTGGTWTTAKLSSILRNPIYVRADNAVYIYFQQLGTNIISPPETFDGIHGLQLYGRTKHAQDNADWSDMKLLVMQHEGLVQADIWLKCQRKLAQNRQIRKAATNQTSWLSGLLFCRICGRSMTTIKGKAGNTTRRYFTCTGKSHLKICPGPSGTIYAESMEAMVFDSIAQKLGTMKAVRKNKCAPNVAKINALKNQLSEIELAESQLLDALLQNGFHSALLEAAHKKAEKLQKERLAICEKLDALSSKNTEIQTVMDFSKKWQKASFEEKRAVARTLIHHIFIDKDGSVEIVWNI